jgi:hypothetical protein
MPCGPTAVGENQKQHGHQVLITLSPGDLPRSTTNDLAAAHQDGGKNMNLPEPCSFDGFDWDKLALTAEEHSALRDFKPGPSNSPGAAELPGADNNNNNNTTTNNNPDQQLVGGGGGEGGGGGGGLLLPNYLDPFPDVPFQSIETHWSTLIPGSGTDATNSGVPTPQEQQQLQEPLVDPQLTGNYCIIPEPNNHNHNHHQQQQQQQQLFPPGFSHIGATARDDPYGVWYFDPHDGCQIRLGHRHDMDGGVWFGSAGMAAMSLLATSATEGVGFMLGVAAAAERMMMTTRTMTTTSTTTNGDISPRELMHQAARVVREHVPEGGGGAGGVGPGFLDESTFAVPDAEAVSLWTETNRFLPPGTYYDPFHRRPVRYDMPAGGEGGGGSGTTESSSSGGGGAAVAAGGGGQRACATASGRGPGPGSSRQPPGRPNRQHDNEQQQGGAVAGGGEVGGSTTGPPSRPEATTLDPFDPASSPGDNNYHHQQQQQHMIHTPDKGKQRARTPYTTTAAAATPPNNHNLRPSGHGGGTDTGRGTGTGGSPPQASGSRTTPFQHHQQQKQETGAGPTVRSLRHAPRPSRS